MGVVLMNRTCTPMPTRCRLTPWQANFRPYPLLLTGIPRVGRASSCNTVRLQRLPRQNITSRLCVKAFSTPYDHCLPKLAEGFCQESGLGGLDRQRKSVGSRCKVGYAA